ncbi:MAG: dynamin family protein [Porphyromonas sp.]|uniref:dynamin family protein n=1 Tax=Porphyromonas sp. TaxID=1924944 RepID=UPI001CADB502|nr:dynamin family protein [Porphyromonas sp.]MBF1405801.1 dynamin family protein [Porphyromonas sp.]
MESLNRIIEIAESLEQKSIAERLRAIDERTQNPSAQLILPLIGEFSAGKTSLINALTDSKVLETASLPTTATLYQIIFGAPENKAVALSAEGEEVELQLDALKNDELKKYPTVTLFDTSTKVPKDIIFVDTPGLSSPDPRHREVLTSILPRVDAILLTVDANQAVTRSLVEFVKSMRLAEKPIYLILNKIDTKSPSELQDLKRGIARDVDLPIDSLVCASAYANNISELQQLLSKIQGQKTQIIAKVDALRTKELIGELRSFIAEILRSSSSPKELKEAVRAQERELERLQSNIRQLMERVEEKLSDKVDETQSSLRTQLWSSLNGILSKKGISYNDAIKAEVINVKTILLQNFTRQVATTIREVNASSRDIRVQLPSAETIDLSQLGEQIDNIPMEDFDSVGHGWDKAIGWATVGLASVAGVATLAATGGLAALGIGGAAGATGAAGAATAAGVALEAGEAAVMATTAVKTTKMMRMMNVMSKAGSFIQKGHQISSVVSSAAEKERGFIEGLVGKATEFFSKPRREAAVEHFLDAQILPNFEADLRNYLSESLRLIGERMNAEAATLVGEKREALSQLQAQQEQEQAKYEAEIKAMKEKDQYLATFSC